MLKSCTFVIESDIVRYSLRKKLAYHLEEKTEKSIITIIIITTRTGTVAQFNRFSTLKKHSFF